MKSLRVIIWGFMLLTSGCEPQGFYPLTKEEVISHEASLPGEVCIVQGADGPYRKGPSAIGRENTEGWFQAESKYGPQPPVKWPATPGYHYEVNSYINEFEECLYVVRKVQAREN